MFNAKQNTVELLDTTGSGSYIRLLNGHGCPLETGGEPVYLTFAQGEEQRNSLGELYQPQHQWESGSMKVRQGTIEYSIELLAQMICLPEGTEIISCQKKMRNVQFIVQHASIPETELMEGELPPRLQATFTDDRNELKPIEVRWEFDDGGDG